MIEDFVVGVSGGGGGMFHKRGWGYTGEIIDYVICYFKFNVFPSGSERLPV